ncbi:GNAT family N-acetyltransferase [Arenimonas daejeonensis]|uniref:GNAT family N-acetyltransferase n=1 Tax=Arenimonas daejeonensis TaxID=370777 RepID=UPI0011BEB532|nr:GNAT family N-acetyltransferase [Arenimonas daejeonensis]
MSHLILETERLRLHELAGTDTGFILELLNDPDFLRFIGDRQVRTHEDALRYLAEGPLASYAANGYGLWRVERRSDGRVIGMCGLVRRETLPHPDIGYAYLPAFRGQGYAVEAGAAVLRHGFSHLGLPRILAIVTDANAGSVRVLEKLGLMPQGRQSFGGEPLLVYGCDAPGAIA